MLEMRMDIGRCRVIITLSLQNISDIEEYREGYIDHSYQLRSSVDV